MLCRGAWYALIFILLAVKETSAIYSTRFLATPPPLKKQNYETKFINLSIDHFSFTSDKTFKLRYLINTTFHKPDGPIFFYTGNEGDIKVFAENSGFLWEQAPSHNAAVIFAEHRYYGLSLPFGEDSFKNSSVFGYMTAEQALADFAVLLTELKWTDEFKNSPVIAFGGSYGGMLSAWFRQKYPNLVAGSIAASAPVWLFPNMSDCSGFFRTATNVFASQGSSVCVNTVRSSWTVISDVSHGPDGLEFLSNTFALCNPLTDVNSLIDFLTDFLSNIAMANYPYETSFLGSLPAYPVKYFCDNLPETGDTYPPLDVIRIANAVRSLANFSQTLPCIDLHGDSTGLSANGWDIQTCLEMTTPMCSDGVKDMFPPNPWSPVVFAEYCSKKYGTRPRMNWAGLEFWGKDLRSATNIVFSNGDLDPWSAFGVLTANDAPHATVIHIPSGAHHLDLRGSNPVDPEDVTSARQQEGALIKKWINEWPFATSDKGSAGKF